MLGIPQQDHPALDDQIRARRRHHRFQRRRRYLLGAQPGGRAARSARSRTCRPASPRGLAPITTPLGEMFMFTIEGGDLSLAERRTPARLDDPPGAAHAARRRRRQFARRLCPQLRDRARQSRDGGARHLDRRCCRRRSRPTTATAAPAVSPTARRCCWSASTARCARSTICATSWSRRATAAWSGSATSPRCGSAASPATAR